MALRHLFIGFLTAAHLLAGFNPALASAAAEPSAEHCAPAGGDVAMDVTAGHEHLHHAGMPSGGDTSPLGVATDDGAHDNCGHECRQCAACAMLPTAVAPLADVPDGAGYLATRIEFRLALRTDEFLRPPSRS